MGLLDNVPQAENYEEKCLCVFAIDVSGSMYEQPINELNIGLQQFKLDVANDPALCAKLEIGIVTFADRAIAVQNPALLDAFDMPILKANGCTKTVDGVRLAMKMVRERKDYWHQAGVAYRRPWIVVITDGEPDGDQDIKALYQEIETEKAKKGFQFLPVGITDADMKKLAQMSNDVPKKLDGLNFAKFFSWLSSSFSKISQSKEGDKIKFAKPDWTEEEYIV